MPRPDFTGYATKYGVRCSDGRTIRHNAFADCDGKQVPIVWEHNHDNPDNVIGHGILRHCADGVKIEGYFNDSYYGEQSKKIVSHGDVNSLSICANHVVEKDKNVMHGNIKEVSLVLCGANPEAVIENVIIEHSDGSYETIIDEAIIFNTAEDAEFNIEHTDENKEDEKKFESIVAKLDEDLEHSDKEDKTVGDIFDAMTEDQKTVALFLIAKAAESKSEVKQSDFDDEVIEHADGETTVGDIFNAMSEEQKNVVLYLMSKAIEESKTINQSDESEEIQMKYNAFENSENQEIEFTHSDANDLIATAKQEKGSLKESMLMHGDQDYGIEDIGLLFPDEEFVDKKIELIRNNPTDWVSKVMSGIKKSPFSRIKMMSSDLTADTARARGYVKGTQKLSQVLGLAKRVISPTTIYKMQKLDRDDIIDVTTMNVVAWIKAELRIQLEEEIARTILIGDTAWIVNGAEYDGDYTKIDTNCIKPILHDYDADFYSVRHFYTLGTDDDEYARFVDECVLGLVDYQGAGSPVLFVEPAVLARCLLLKDGIGNRIYKTKGELASAIGVRDIIEVPYMKNRTYTDLESTEQNTMMIPTAGTESDKMLVKGIIVNLNDYVYGADKGGAVNMFDDFDIDFNQYKYLIETRGSGALTKYHSAILVGEIVSD